MSAQSTLKVGIVGLGRLGRRHAENLLRRVSGAVLVAACSPVEAELTWAKETLGINDLYEDYEALLAHEGLDAVFLVTPTSLHPHQIIQALKAGKHVFCEKPLSLDLNDCRRVSAEAALHPQLKVMIGFVRRFDASYQAAYQKIQSGSIGQPFMVYSQTCDQLDPDGFFVKFAPTSGGIFLDCSVHDIDLARWLLGNPKPVRVFASGTIAVHQDLQSCADVDNGVAICEFENGRIATFYASRTMPHGHETVTEVTGTAGRLTVGRNARQNRLEIADARGIRNECTPTFFERFEDAFLTEAAYFVDAIRNNTPLSLTLDDATEATRIGIAMRESLLSKLPVML
ncbi:Gfo/Idh/MocA family oxidoreductase [Glaciimonas sp. PCH181]|uniref:Gfo/Idh/MocA family oxidoreductase n=1 Tax=Glaciimonas sp. PCH181 TaxID=2133943 RepID=UPI000D361394|nr:Gfo/Idh/MocA family oxidoreductase [Glaciimonas sp. PCH181]PUA19759.1 oxidoreductase [Glaciimonas sp. PCH181]